MKQKLTKTVIDALACKPGQRDYLVYDTEIIGFAVCVLPSGNKTFFLQYTRAGKTKRLPLGRYGEITVFEARKKALLGRAELVEGIDPLQARLNRQAERQAAEEARKQEIAEDALTVEKLLELWKTIGLKAAGAGHQSESPRAIGRLLAAHLTTAARKLTPAQAQAAVDDLSITAPIMAVRSMKYSKAAFSWATRRKLIPSNPFAGVECETREKSRERVLSDHEVGEAWRAAGELAQPWRAYFRMTMLTLQRRGEVAEMEWSEIDPDMKFWTVPAARAKNRKAHIVHLSEPAKEILRAVPRYVKCKYVFTTTGDVPINSFTRAKEWLDAKILKERGNQARDMPPLSWTVHDFRRTGVTVLAGMGFAIHVADKLLNHVQGSIRGVAAVYNRQEFLPERARALDAWAAYVLAQAKGEQPASNVVSMTG